MQLQNIQITGGLTFIPEILSPSGDPYWANVSLLMNTTSTNNQTNNTFLDGSTNNFTVTRAGPTTQGSFTPFTVAPNTSYNPSVNGGSGYFNGSSSLSTPSDAAFAYGTGDFTWELWVYMNTTSGNQYILDHGANSGTLTYNNGLRYYNPTTGIGSVLYNTAPALISGTWNHIAVARESGTTRLFLNGTLVVSGADPNNFASASITIAQFGGGGLYYNGYMASVRVVKGTAVYTSAFTPPTTALTAIANTSLLLNFTNAGMFDGTTKNNLVTVGDAKVSTTQSKFAPTSVAFDGTGDYLTALSNTIFTFGTGDFTVETWVYLNNVTGSKFILDMRPENTDGVYPVLYMNGATATWYINSAARLTGTVSATTWTHIAISRSSGVSKMFINGVQAGSNYTDANNYLSAAPAIGSTRFPTGSNTLNGFLQDLRITKGVARYTANFTPPTAPFPTN